VRLLLDSSGSDLVCALADSQGVVIERRDAQRGDAGRDISASVGHLLGELKPADIEGIVVGLGPGSFIGTRVAICFANGYAAAGGTPLQGVNSLAAIGMVHGGGRSIILRYARRGEYYYYMSRNGGEETGIVDAGALAALMVRELVSRVVYEVAESSDADARMAELERICASAGASLSLCDGVPAEGLRRAQASVPAESFVEPVYLRGFL
jgi:tRNA threonylcarbamoyl adenosine modification protein YeaZ